VKKKLTILLVKIAIGAALLAFIVWKMAPEWDKSRIIITNLFRYRVYRFIAGILCFGLVVCLGTYRWKLLLRAHQVDLRFCEVIKLFFVGHFFSQFMPGGIAGGDIVKSFYVSTHTDDRKHEAVTTIFIDRIMGIFGLFGVLVIAVLINLGSLGHGRYIIYDLAILAAISLILVLFFSKGLLRRIGIITRIVDKIPYKEFIARIYNAFHYYKDHKLVLLIAFILSTTVHLILAIMVYLIASGLGLDTPLRKYFIIVSLVNFVGSLPISPLGTLGTLDLAYIKFFEKEVAENTGIPGAIALLVRLIYAFWGLVGLFVWLFLKSQMRSNSLKKVTGLEHVEAGINEVRK